MDSGLSRALANTHQAILNSLQVDQDKILADRLENFFNRIIYNRPAVLSSTSLGQTLDNYLTDQLVVRIQKSLKIPEEPKFTWQTFEKIIGDISQKMINNIFNTRGKLSSAQTGTQQTYVPILENIPEEYKELFFQELSVVQDGENTRTYAKMGKNDVFISAKIKPEMEQELAILENLSFSIKNYSGTIKLEAVNPLKGYLAIMQNFKSEIKETNLIKSYMDYYINGIKQDDTQVTNHLNHILRVYALTGLGNVNLITGQQVGATRFLVVNTGRNIRVYSTAEMIQDLLEGGQQTFSFDIKKSKKPNGRDMITVKKLK